MTVTYSLSEEDYLNQILYEASQIKTIQAKIKKSKKNIIFSYTIVFLALWYLTTLKAAIPIFLLGLIYFLYYNFSIKKLYVKEYKKYVDENYKYNLSIDTKLTISDDFIINKDQFIESKISTKEIEKLAETAEYIHIKLYRNIFISIPKTKIEQPNKLASYLKEIAATLNIEYVEDLDWKW